MRRRAKLNGQSDQMMEAASGVTLGAMLQITLFTPMKMLLAEPIVILVTLYLGFNFAVIFQFFITVPAVLEGVYGFEVQHVGIAFVAAIVGALLAASTCIIIDRLTWPKQMGKSTDGMVAVEYRLYPAMIGGFLITASLFWIGWTAGTVSWPSPVLGTMLYVWGNLMVLVSELHEQPSEVILIALPRFLSSLIFSKHTHLGEPYLPSPPQRQSD